MKSRVLTLVVALILLSAFHPVSASSVTERPYVYTPTVPETALSVLALYQAGDYGRALEGCEWLLQLKTPFGSWGRVYGAEHEAKFTGLALMALIRGESIARGRYNETINGAAYWLIFKQNEDGSWEDYLGTAIAVTALEEFVNSKYVNPHMPNFKEQVRKAIDRGRAWLSTHQPQTDAEKAFRATALNDKDSAEKMEPGPFKYFALAYLGEKPKVPQNEMPQDSLEMALLLYATKDERYYKELVKMEHFGFWGTLRYNPVELMEASSVSGFEDLRSIACPYLAKIKPQLKFNWERVVYAKYFLECGMSPDLLNLSAYNSLRPWQIAEVARIKAILGKPYETEVDYLLHHMNGTGWGDFYNTEYVVWVLHDLNVSVDYKPILNFLESNLTNTSPTYYYAYAVLVFKEFNREKALNRTLVILEKRQSPEGGWGYTTGTPAGIKSTATVVWALEKAGLLNTDIHRRGWNFLKKALYIELPEPTSENGVFKMENATILRIGNGGYLGNATAEVKMDDLDGIVYIYTSKTPLVIQAVPREGFTAENPWESQRRQYVALVVSIAGIIASFYGIVLFENRRKRK